MEMTNRRRRRGETVSGGFLGVGVAQGEAVEVVGGSEPAVIDGSGALGVIARWCAEMLPDALQASPFLLRNWQWLGLLLLLLGCAIVDRIVRAVAGRVFSRLTAGRDLSVEEKLLRGFERPFGLLGAALAFGFFLPALGLTEYYATLALAADFVATVAGVWAVYRFVDLLCGVLERKAKRTVNKFDDMLVPLVRRTLKIFVVVVGLVYLASRWTEDPWGVVAGLGLGSIAVGFAAKDSIENLFGTFTVLSDKPFQIGDWVIVGTLEGTVERVGFRSTRIRTFYNSLITVPNRTFISSDVDNMGQRTYRRIKTTLGLTYDTPPEKIEAFCEGIRELIRTHPYTRKDYYHVYLNGFGAASLEVLVYCFVATPEWATELREKHRLFADILRLAQELGVSFAFPTQTIHVARPEDAVHDDVPAGDRDGQRRGRRAASEVVERSMADWGGTGSIPPPVVISTTPRAADDGDDGG